MSARLARLLVLLTGCVMLAGCPAEVGSERWCKNMKEKPKGDWTASEASDYAKHCLFGSKDD